MSDKEVDHLGSVESKDETRRGLELITGRWLAWIRWNAKNARPFWLLFMNIPQPNLPMSRLFFQCPNRCAVSSCDRETLQSSTFSSVTQHTSIETFSETSHVESSKWVVDQTMACKNGEDHGNFLIGTRETRWVVCRFPQLTYNLFCFVKKGAQYPIMNVGSYPSSQKRLAAMWYYGDGIRTSNFWAWPWNIGWTCQLVLTTSLDMQI